MRTVHRSKQPVYYALYIGKRDKKVDGLKTGEKDKIYSAPVLMLANVSPAKGTSSVDIFGKDDQYTKTVLTCDMDCPITEESVLWIDCGLTVKSGVPDDLPYNYVVVKVAKSKNNIVYAVREVNAT